MSESLPLPLAGKVVIITGAASGIGRAAAGLFAANGCRLVLVDINGALLDQVMAKLGGASPTAIAIAADVSDDRELDGIIDKVQQRFGRIDVLINNAGLVMGGHFADGDPAKLRKLVEVNLYAPLRLSQLVIPVMKAQGSGQILNVFSASALLSIPGFAGYGATKAGLFAFTRTLRRELDGTGIHLTALCPGSTATGMTEGMIASGKGLGQRPHHGPEVPAKAMVDAVRYRRPVVIVSGQPRAQAIASFLDRLFPNLMHKFWVKQADEDYYDAVSRTKP